MDERNKCFKLDHAFLIRLFYIQKVVFICATLFLKLMTRSARDHELCRVNTRTIITLHRRIYIYILIKSYVRPMLTVNQKPYVTPYIIF